MRKRLIKTGAAVVLVALIAVFAYVRIDNPEGEPHMNPTATDGQLKEVGGATVLFAHQSVGVNVLDGISAVYQAQGLPAPSITDLSDGAASTGGLMHVRIGANGDPLGKIAAFDAMIRSGLGDEVDVAMLKLCYADVRAGANIAAVFAAYRDTIASLQRDYPDVTFVAATVPLNVKRDPIATIKGWLGRGDNYGPEHNVLREELNELLREEYAASGLLFDVAATESTTPSGERITGRHGGRTYYALDRAYASDRGHLNESGALVAAHAFLVVVARALGE